MTIFMINGRKLKLNKTLLDGLSLSEYWQQASKNLVHVMYYNVTFEFSY